MFEVYIHEAHAGENNTTYPEFAQFNQPATMAERITIFEFYRSYIPSKPLVQGDTVIIPALIDSISKVWESKYSTLPTCGYVIGFDGKIKVNTGFLTGSAQMTTVENAIKAELATVAVHTSTNKIMTNSITSYQSIVNRIVVNGLNEKTAGYALFQIDGSLLQKGFIKSKAGFIALERDYKPGVYILKISEGTGDISVPVMLK